MVATPAPCGFTERASCKRSLQRSLEILVGLGGERKTARIKESGVGERLLDEIRDPTAWNLRVHYIREAKVESRQLTVK